MQRVSTAAVPTNGPPESQGSSERVPGEERRPRETGDHPADGLPARSALQRRHQSATDGTVVLKALGHQISSLRVRLPLASLTRFWASSPAEAASQAPSSWSGEGGWRWGCVCVSSHCSVRMRTKEPQGGGEASVASCAGLDRGSLVPVSRVGQKWPSL